MGGWTLPIVSIVVPFSGLPFRILNIKWVKPKKGTPMETIGTFRHLCDNISSAPDLRGLNPKPNLKQTSPKPLTLILTPAWKGMKAKGAHASRMSSVLQSLNVGA